MCGGGCEAMVVVNSGVLYYLHFKLEHLLIN